MLMQGIVALYTNYKTCCLHATSPGGFLLPAAAGTDLAGMTFYIVILEGV